ncbi:MAG: PQQ-binding-like beta-propeller repeat protein [Steroidobacteraceae bacterium]
MSTCDGRSRRFFWVTALVPAAAFAAAAQAPFTEKQLAARNRGQFIYESFCVNCHGVPVSRAPVPAVLRSMTADQVLRALNEGPMQAQAAALSADDRRAVAEFLTNQKLGSGAHESGIPRCGNDTFDAGRNVAVREWGLDAHNTRHQSLADAGLAPGDLTRLEVAWTIALPGAIQVRSQPTFAGGWLFMGSQDGTVYALDAKTGCRHWEFHAQSEVRTTISLAPWSPSTTDPHPTAVFGDHLGSVYAVDARDGRLLWKVRPHAHPNAQITGSPRVVAERVLVPFSSHEDISAARPDYSCCTFRGAVASLDLKTGATQWLSYSVPAEPSPSRKNAVGTQLFAPSGAAIWNSPAVDSARNQLYVGTGDNYSEPQSGTSDSVIAMDLTTGRHRWVYQAQDGGDVWNVACLKSIRGPNCPEKEGPDYDIGAGLVLTATREGRPVLLAGQKSSHAIALDPDTGRLLWRVRLARGGNQGGIHFGMAAADGVAYIPVSDMEMKEDAAVYDRAAQPGLYAVDLTDGRLVWAWHPDADTCKGREYCDPGISAPPTIIGEHVIVGALDGVLRVHDRATGKVVWSFDTTRPMTGINGVAGQGGSMNAIGPVAHEGLVYVASGYAFAWHMPGNLFIAFRPRQHGDQERPGNGPVAGGDHR